MLGFTLLGAAGFLALAQALPQVSTKPNAILTAIPSSVAGAAAAAPTTASPAASAAYSTPAERAAAVKEAFEFAFNGYWKYCKGHDELHPVTNTCGDPYDGWGASAFDALSTAIIMESTAIVDEILAYIETVDLTMTPAALGPQTISMFETTIRYLGALLSSYDLLKGPFAGLASNNTQVNYLLSQAQTLADGLSVAFNTPTGIPDNGVRYNMHSTDGGTDNNLATAGSLVLEWTHLSDLTGNQTYAQLSQRGEAYLLNPMPLSDEPFPGLVGTNINTTTGLFENPNGSWGGGADSFYEYLIKMFVYDQSRFAHYRDRWVAAVDSTLKYLVSHPQPRPDLTFIDGFNGQVVQNQSGHLNCFEGGNFLLGGSVLGRQDFVELGLAATAGCHDTYIATATGLGPEAFAWYPGQVPADQQAFYQKWGFYITNGVYILRPEVLESYYYAYRLTGNTTYQDWSWEGFLALNNTCRVGSGFSAINNVNVAGGGGYQDDQQSFFFAEVMKYAYIIHAPSAIWQVNYQGEETYVFNTEAHPFKVAGKPLITRVELSTGGGF